MENGVQGGVRVVAAERETRKTDTTIQRAGASAEVLVITELLSSGYWKAVDVHV